MTNTANQNDSSNPKTNVNYETNSHPFSLPDNKTLLIEAALYEFIQKTFEDSYIAWGKDRGRAKGVYNLISTLKELNISDEIISEHLISKYNFSSEEAKEAATSNIAGYIIALRTSGYIDFQISTDLMREFNINYEQADIQLKETKHIYRRHLHKEISTSIFEYDEKLCKDTMYKIGKIQGTASERERGINNLLSCLIKYNIPREDILSQLDDKYHIKYYEASKLIDKYEQNQ